MRADDWAPQRQRMTETIAAHAHACAGETGRAVLSARVMAAIERVPRHEFVPADVVPYSYLDTPLPIGPCETISQPFIVALMTDMAEIGARDRVLEIGTGAGYQAAVLSHLAAQVYSVEIVETLAHTARRRLDRLGCANVETAVGDGYYGWAEAAPFDAIIVTTAPDLIPPPLIQQLAPHGRMVVPAGLKDDQTLFLVEKDNRRTRTREVLRVAFSELRRLDAGP